MRRSNQPTSFFLVTFGLFLTLLFHAGLFALYLYWQTAQAQAAEPQELPVDRVEILMYGEVMPDPHELPFIANPAPEEQPEEVVQIEPQPQPEPQVQEQPQEELPVNRDPEPEPERPRDSTRHNENRPENDEPLVGSPQGVRGGTSLSATALQNMWDPVVRAIQREMGRPGGITDEQIAELQAQVRIYFNAEGRVLRYTWVHESGNRSFDDAVERAVNAFRLGSRRLPLPTAHPEVVEAAIDDGVIITVLPPE